MNTTNKATAEEFGPSISTAIALALEKIVNRALRYDPATQLKLRRLAGQTIQLESNRPRMHCFISVDENFIRIQAHNENEPDAKISGDFTDFIKMGRSQHSFADSSIHVSGKSGLLNELQDILSQLDIDWEEAIIEITGIVPGHFIAETLRKGFAGLVATHKKFESQLPIYLKEELRVIPDDQELNSFYQSVDKLKSDLNRFEARLHKYKQKIAQDNNH